MASSCRACFNGPATLPSLSVPAKVVLKGFADIRDHGFCGSYLLAEHRHLVPTGDEP